MQNDPWFDPPRPARPRRRRPHLFLLALVAVVAATVGLTPWAVHMGDRWTPLMSWDGYGPVVASNGGRYLLYTELHGGLSAGTHRGGCGTTGGCDSLRGTAELCTAGGKVHRFDLHGKVRAWLTTDRAHTSIDLTGGSPWKLQSGWVVAFSGTWDGPELHLTDTDNSFTEEFTRRGDIRRITSTADAGTALATLRYGSHAAFREACGALAARG